MQRPYFQRLRRAVAAFVLAITGVVVLAADPAAALGLVSVEITSQQPAEASGADVMVRISATGPVTVDTSVVVTALGSSTATAGDDYIAFNGRRTIPAFSSSVTFPVTIVDDSFAEPDEQIDVQISELRGDPTNQIDPTSDTATIDIINDDGVAPSLSIATSPSSGAESVTPANFVVTSSYAPEQDVTFDLVFANGTATSDGAVDFTPPVATRFTLGSGQTTTTVTAAIVDDVTDEDNETFSATLTGANNATVGSPASATYTIVDNDAPPVVSVTAAVDTIDEDADPGEVAITATLTPPSERNVRVGWLLQNGTARVTPGGTSIDATGSGTFDFQDGEVSQTATVTITDDAIFETDETFTVALANPVRATLGSNDTITILDDDDAPRLSIGDVSKVEGDTGTSTMNFTLALTGATEVAVVVDAATGPTDPVEADDASDYDAATAEITFAAGQNAKTFPVVIQGDVIDEADEDFLVTLTAQDPTVVTVVDDEAVGTIIDDEGPPVVDISTSESPVIEGDAGTTAVDLTVTLSEPSGRDVIVDVATVDGSATAGDDFTAVDQTLTFTPGQTSKTVTVDVIGDVLFEADETFDVDVTVDPATATAGTTSATVVITDDDEAGQPVISIDDVTALESAGQVLFTVSIDTTAGVDITADVVVTDQTATEGEDYTPQTTRSVTIPSGSTSTTFAVDIDDDDFAEADETYLLTLTNTNADEGDVEGLGTITNNDGPAPMIESFADDAATEGTDTHAEFVVTLDGPAGNDVLIDYRTVDGTAKATTDYSSSTGTLTIASGQSTGTISIPVASLDGDEPETETFTVEISNVRNALPGDQESATSDDTATGTITDVDEAPTVDIDQTVTVDEGDDGATAVDIAVTLSARTDFAVTVGILPGAGEDAGTATEGVDFAAPAATVTIPARSLGGTFRVDVIGDVADEDDETVNLLIDDATNATPGDDGFLVITNDDTAPTISINDVTTDEGNEDTAVASFTLTLSAPSGRTVTVAATTGDGTAIAPGDYTTASGTVTFAPGEQAATFDVTVIGDEVDEPDEQFSVTLSDPTNATLADATGSGTITDDDDAPEVSVGNASVDPEGDQADGTTTVNLVVSLSEPSAKRIQATVTATPGTATETSDFQAASATLTFEAGEVTKLFPVNVVGDDLDEADETFTAVLSGIANAVKGTDGTVTIVDDDDEPTLAIDDAVTAEERQSGDTSTTIDVTLSAASGQTVTVDYTTGDGTATPNVDYRADTGTVTFAPGETLRTITVKVVGDTLDEDDQTFEVTLTDPTNAGIDVGTSVVTIADDDDAPTISIADANAVEGDTGTATSTVAISLSAPSEKTITVDVTPTDGTATSPSDYTAIPVDDLAFAAGETQKTFAVQVVGDEIPEPAEQLAIALSGATNATIGDGASVFTIADNDGDPQIFIDDVSVVEGNTGTIDAVFTVTLSKPSGTDITATVETADDFDAEAGSDYVATSVDLTFEAGQTEKTVIVVVSGDTTAEDDEQFATAITATSDNVDIADAEGVGTIIDDDTPTLNIADNVTIAEGNVGPSTATFEVTLDPVSNGVVTVDYATSDGTATAPTDYTATSGTLTFAAGESSKLIEVEIIADTRDEGSSEQFTVTLTGAVGANIDDGSGTGAIIDDDPAPTITIGNVSVGEGDDGDLPTASFTVTLSNPSQRTVTVEAASADGTATAGVDYTAVATTTLTFNPGQVAKTVTATVIGDDLDEADETFVMQLANATNASVGGTGTGTATITDDDGPDPTNWFIRNTASTGVADRTFEFGLEGDRVLACDWNGDGTDTPALFRNGTWLLNSGFDGTAETTFGYGRAGDIPLCGDWDRNGTDTPGVFRGQTFYLKNTNRGGAADLTFAFGRTGDTPVAGDWDGDGRDTVGVFRGNVTYLVNQNRGGRADLNFGYGTQSDVKVVGDWDGNGTDTFGVRRGNKYYIRNTNSSGSANFVFGYGVNTDVPVAGDFAGSGRTGIGIVRG